MAQGDSREARFASAERLIEELVTRQCAAEAVDFEAFVAVHRHLEAELRELSIDVAARDHLVESGSAALDEKRPRGSLHRERDGQHVRSPWSRPVSL